MRQDRLCSLLRLRLHHCYAEGDSPARSAPPPRRANGGCIRSNAEVPARDDLRERDPAPAGARMRLPCQAHAGPTRAPATVHCELGRRISRSYRLRRSSSLLPARGDTPAATQRFILQRRSQSRRLVPEAITGVGTPVQPHWSPVRTYADASRAAAKNRRTLPAWPPVGAAVALGA